MRASRYFLLTVVLLWLCQSALAQLGISFDIKKPREYEERVLRSERSEEKKFTLPRRFMQNTATRYNFFFNANNTLNEVIAQAKSQHQDDFTSLLPFYNYSLENTSANRLQLDSIISRSSTGLVLHDLRNDWADNLYLLIGAAYYLRKDFDSAALTFQFINYAFAPKEKDGYYQVIGSRFDGNNAMSIATKEKTNLPKKIFAEPPSRNDAFIWQIRTFMARKAFAEAASLIVTLRNDPSFPKRLQNDLNEVQALWYYEQQQWDSAAVYLVKALDNAPTKKERARWEFLAAQLFEGGKQFDKSREFYEKVISHTTDPVMEIYARLNAIRTNKDNEQDYTDRNISELLKMARKDKFVDYRDIIFFTIGQMELERGRTNEAMAYIEESTRYSSNNPAQRTRAFLLLGDLAFRQQQYRRSSSYYDSIAITSLSMQDGQQFMERKTMLGIVAKQIDIIYRQDSLLRLADLPEEDRNEFIRKMVRQLRRQQGLKEDERGSVSLPGNETPASNDLFGAGPAKGEWYFYNAALRTKGEADFRTRWGNRPNADNWRRISAVNLASRLPEMGDRGQVSPDGPPSVEIPLTFEGLLAQVPLTDEKKKIAQDSLQKALFELGKAYAEKIEDCRFSVQTLDRLRTEFPSFEPMDEVLFLLHYCLKRSGNDEQAQTLFQQLQKNYPNSKYASQLVPGKKPELDNATKSNPVSAEYEKVYELFIEGDFEQAVARKKKADSLYGSNYWTPQLLYIEAIYHIRQREDGIAMNALHSIINKYPDHVLSERSRQLIAVLGRRKEIEEELGKLPNPDDSVMVAQTPAPSQVTPPVVTTQAPVVNQPNPPKQGQDSLMAKRPVLDTVKKAPALNVPANATYSHREDQPHYVMLILYKVDKVWGNETNSAFTRYNREKPANRNLANTLVELDADTKLLLIGTFENASLAIQYLTETRPLTPSRIVPWLTPSKYTFSLISNSNLELLKQKKAVGEYQMYIQGIYQGKF
ncbi:MAG: tetratricopeptide repeat protein [Chitinophagales bacterium]|nr:tetratricopeptide repeat protein [Chitinophagales bacterium]